MSPAKWQPFCIGLNMLTRDGVVMFRFYWWAIWVCFWGKWPSQDDIEYCVTTSRIDAPKHTVDLHHNRSANILLTAKHINDLGIVMLHSSGQRSHFFIKFWHTKDNIQYILPLYWFCVNFIDVLQNACLTYTLCPLYGTHWGCLFVINNELIITLSHPKFALQMLPYFSHFQSARHVDFTVDTWTIILVIWWNQSPELLPR